MTTTSHAGDDLFHALATRARATSDGRLVIAVTTGLAAALSVASWRPVGWLVIASVGMFAAAFGAFTSVLVGGIGAVAVALLWMRLFPEIAKIDKIQGRH